MEMASQRPRCQRFKVRFEVEALLGAATLTKRHVVKVAKGIALCTCKTRQYHLSACRQVALFIGHTSKGCLDAPDGTVLKSWSIQARQKKKKCAGTTRRRRGSTRNWSKDKAQGDDTACASMQLELFLHYTQSTTNCGSFRLLLLSTHSMPGSEPFFRCLGG